MIDLGTLRTFVAVVDIGTVHGAARHCGYAPSAVSRQIARLQARLGVTLFLPDGRTIRPTAACIALADRARDLLSEAQRFESFARDLGEVGAEMAAGRGVRPR